MSRSWTHWHIAGIGTVALGAITTAGYLLGIDATLEQQRQRDTDRATLDELTEQADTLQAQRRALAHRIERADEQLATDSITLRPRSALNEVLAELTDEAQQASLRVDQLQPREAVDGALFDTVPLTLTGRGSYPDTVRFLHQLHEQHADLLVRGLTISRDDRAASGGGVFSLDLAWRAAKPSGV